MICQFYQRLCGYHFVIIWAISLSKRYFQVTVVKLSPFHMYLSSINSFQFPPNTQQLCLFPRRFPPPVLPNTSADSRFSAWFGLLALTFRLLRLFFPGVVHFFSPTSSFTSPKTTASHPSQAPFPLFPPLFQPFSYSPFWNSCFFYPYFCFSCPFFCFFPPRPTLFISCRRLLFVFFVRFFPSRLQPVRRVFWRWPCLHRQMTGPWTLVH